MPTRWLLPLPLFLLLLAAIAERACAQIDPAHSVRIEVYHVRTGHRHRARLPSTTPPMGVRCCSAGEPLHVRSSATEHEHGGQRGRSVL